jgi:hypothetical protein
MKRRLWRGALAAALAMLVAATAASAAPLSATDRTAALAAIENAIRKTYVFPQRTPAILAALDRGTQSGRYDTADANAFAQRVTEDLKAASQDGHLYLDNDPEHYLAALAPEKSAAGIAAYHRKMAAQDNSGLAAMDILPGNVRYLRIAGFEWVPRSTAQIYDAALRFLKGGDAVIIDLRDNGGGDGDAADYLLDAILKPGTLLYTRHEGARITQSRTRRNHAGLSLAGKPLFVLVDSHTGSAAEAFAYAVQQERAGTILGAATYGAANNNRIFPIAPQFVLSVSYARPVSAVTGTNWEGVGVTPDIAVPATTARVAAQLAALDRLAGAPETTPQARAAYRWIKTGLQVQLDPVTLSPERLSALTGSYGSVTISLMQGELRLSRADRPKWPTDIPLAPLTSDGLFEVHAFAFDDLRVRLTGPALELLYGSDDAAETIPRSH